MKLLYSVEEYQSVLPTSKQYGNVLRLLARLGALEVERSPDRKSKLEKEVSELAATIYLPKVGDVLSFEHPVSGFRYKCTVKEIRTNGWLIGDPTSFHERYWILLDVVRNNKQVYRW